MIRGISHFTRLYGEEQVGAILDTRLKKLQRGVAIGQVCAAARRPEGTTELAIVRSTRELYTGTAADISAPGRRRDAPLICSDQSSAPVAIPLAKPAAAAASALAGTVQAP